MVSTNEGSVHVSVKDHSHSQSHLIKKSGSGDKSVIRLVHLSPPHLPQPGMEVESWNKL